MLPDGVAPDGSLLYLYLPNCHINVVKSDDHSSSLRLWYPELASIRDRYLPLISFGNISLKVGPQWTGHVSAWLSHAGSKNNLTFLFGFGTSTNICTILPSHPCLVVWWCPAAAATLIRPWIASVMCKLHTVWWILNTSCVYIAYIRLAWFLCVLCWHQSSILLKVSSLCVCVSIVLQLIVKTSRVSVSGMPNRARPFMGATKNLHNFCLFCD